MIKVENLTKKFANFIAVDNISFNVEKGDILGFLGPNGAGKTTVMRILTGYLSATSGKAFVCGYDVQTQPIEVKKRIGYVPENPPLYSDMSVKSYLDFSAKIKGVPSNQRESRINEVMNVCKITDVKDKLISKLSKGYRQRVGIAQAIIHNPEVLILDEPTSGLDPKQIIETRELIKSLGSERTVILSTHILPEVSMTCNKVTIINKGKICASDTMENLTSNLEGKERLKLYLSGDEQKIMSIINSIENISSVKSETTSDTNNNKWYYVEYPSSFDLREKISSKLVENEIGVLEITSQKATLEEVFLKLTQTEEVMQN